ncbi:MAG TPA: hypothetical protein VF456_07250 [Vicinamibacterales bacterium]
MICPIDLTGAWESDAIRAADVARIFDVPLLLVHVLRRLRAVHWLPETNRPRDRHRIATATTALQRVSARLPQDVGPPPPFWLVIRHTKSRASRGERLPSS